MQVNAISAIFGRGQGSSPQQSPLRDDMQGLQKALSTGNLANAQKALNQLRQDVQGIRPPQNGVRPEPEVNPAATMRVDMDVLQKALNAGDLPAAQRAVVRMQQDSQQIAAAARQASQGARSKAAGSSNSDTESAQNGTGPSEVDESQKSTGNLIDVSA